MKLNFTFTMLTLFFCSNLFCQNIIWEVNDATSWQTFMQSGSNASISNAGQIVPDNHSADYTFSSKVISFDRLLDAQDIVFKQSPVWDNWIPAENIQPTGSINAPVFVPVEDGDNYYFAGYIEGGYHAWHSTDMQTWTHKGPVTSPEIGRWVTSAEMKNGSFYIYADDLNDETPRLFIDDNLDDGIPGIDMGHVFVKENAGSDCSLFRDDEDGLFHLIYEDWSPINARQNSWDSLLAGL